jgi:hypothetical protein
MKRSLLTVPTALGLLFAGSAAAHDFFLVPEGFVGAGGRPLIVHATSSSDFPALNVGSPRTRIEAARAVVGGQPAAVEVQAQAAKSLPLSVSTEASGMGVVTVQTIWGESNWRPDQVEIYLEEHPFKAEEVAAVHRLLPQGAPLQIRSRRLAKTLVCVRVCTPTTSASAGLEVELVPAFDAGGASPSRFQLVRNGRPLAGYPVAVRPARGERQNVLTDDDGWVRMPAGLSGPVMLVAATLDPPKEPGGRFVTNNASVTFEAGQGHGGAH